MIHPFSFWASHTIVGWWWFSVLWFLFNPRINLSPFTKDFRGEEHYNESFIISLFPAKRGENKITVNCEWNNYVEYKNGFQTQTKQLTFWVTELISVKPKQQHVWLLGSYVAACSCIHEKPEFLESNNWWFISDHSSPNNNNKIIQIFV